MIRVSKTATQDLIFLKGDSFYFDFQVKDSSDNVVNLDQYTFAKMQIKENEYSPALIEFTSTGNTYKIDITDLSAGHMVISAPVLSLYPTSYLYDLQLSNGDTIETIMRGKIIIEDEVTT